MGQEAPGAVRLISIPLNHTGSTEYVLREAAGSCRWPDYSGILYIAPKPEKLTEAQKTFHRIVKGPYLPPRFLTPGLLSRMVFDRVGQGKRLPSALVPPVLSELSGLRLGFSAALASVLREFKQFHPAKPAALIGRELKEIFARLGVPEEMHSALEQAVRLFGRYQEVLDASGYSDDDDVLVKTGGALSRMPVEFSILVADGFSFPTAAEAALLRELLLKSGLALVCSAGEAFLREVRSSFSVTEERLGPNTDPDLSYVKYAGVEDEIEGVARHIKNLYLAGRTRPGDSVCVALPRLPEHADLIERVFGKYSLPFSLSSPVPASRRPALRDVLYLIESAAEDFPRSKFTSVLSSPFFKTLPPRLRMKIQALSLGSGIVKGKDAWENIGGGEAGSEEVREGLHLVFGWLRELLPMRTGARAESINNAVRDVLARFGFEAAKEELDAFETALESLTLIGELSGVESLSLSRYAEFLRHVLGSIDLGREAEGIRVLDLSEVSGLEPQHLYLCGLKDGDLPAKPPVDHLLPDTVRTAYGLRGLTDHLEMQRLHFFRAAGSTRNLHLSYPGIDGDKVFLPSPYLPWGRELKERVYGIFTHEELATRRGTAPLSAAVREIKIRGGIRERIIGRDLSMPMRVTDIDAYRRCPRRFFIERVLRLSATEIAEYEVEARVLGTAIHEIMERLLSEPLSDLQAVIGRAPALVAQVLEGYPVERYWRELIGQAFLGLLPNIVELESGLRDEGFSPHRLEMKVEEEVLPGIRLKGKIDRLDRSGAIFRLIDYKTGGATVGSEIIKKGKELQLPLYAAMLRTAGMEVEKAGVYSLKEIGIKWIPTPRDKNSMEDYISSALAWLEGTVREIQDGNFPARPVEEFFCESCCEVPFCPYIHEKGGMSDDLLS